MNLTSPAVIKQLMEESGITFKKKFGQNFLINKEIPYKIAQASIVTNAKKTACIEIGPGIGVLTEQLASVYDKVVSFEIDSDLIPILEKTLAGKENVTIINKDILEVDLKKYIEENLQSYTVSVCANLPYYVTTPIIMSLLETKANISRIVVMIQKEVAVRLTSKAGSNEYGAITPTVDYYAQAKKLFDVAPGNFIPKPEVTSTVISLDVRTTSPVSPLSEETLFKTIRGAFALRRKTITNSLATEFGMLSKEQLSKCLEKAGISPTCRGETLTLNDLCELSNQIYKTIN